MVVRDWAPQLQILAHKSTGGFMSHCGWNSCFESLLTGVPVAAWPMHSDQPLNALFLTRVLKTGLVVREWVERKELVTASVIKNVVERLMASEEGVEIRKGAEELSAAIKLSMDEDGEAGCPDMESFIAHITR
ncbi:UNVERIFIED_CONTAM: Zeatin O-xylosyltransferase [Sesamum radiatum]|uniref:Zeatin O-xylosyltransferase n=1 Tax=Sesamum radiatum TaxID=300843 RepID=A0AAW2N863_SESRA